jgi:hypothetical protein
MNHRVISPLMSAMTGYREGRVTLEDLRARFSAAISLLEGDVPKIVHEAVRRTEAELDSALFYEVDVEAVLRRFEAVLAECDDAEGQ